MSIFIPIVRQLGKAVATRRYDAYIAAIGFERRSRFVSEEFDIKATSKFAGAFPDRKEFHYSDNLVWFEKSGFEIQEVDESSFASWCDYIFEQISVTKGFTTRICVDISSLTRSRIAMLVDCFRKSTLGVPIEADFVYSIAKFSPPPSTHYPNRIVGPVLPSFAGWSTEPEKSPVAIVGLGYEEDKALGAVEHIQAAEVWAFMPLSPIKKYRNELEGANEILLNSIPKERRLDYDVYKPLDCFITLESLTNRILKLQSPVLFPFGPKIFTLCALLVACVHPSASVWRVSTGTDSEPIDRLPSKYFCGLTVEFKSESEL